MPVKRLVLLAVAPLTLLFGLLAGLFHQLVWHIWKFDSLTGSLLGSAIFILALVLSGTLSKYKASEVMLLFLVNETQAINVRLAVDGAAAPDLNGAAIPTNAWHCVRPLQRLQPLERVIVEAGSQPQPSPWSRATSFLLTAPAACRTSSALDGLAAAANGGYVFSALVLKEREYRLDGLFLPPAPNPGTTGRCQAAAARSSLLLRPP